MLKLKALKIAAPAVTADSSVMLENKVLPDHNTVLGVEDIASLLLIAPRTVRSLAERGVLPAMKVGRAWRFQSADIAKLLGRSQAPLAVSPFELPVAFPRKRSDTEGALRGLLGLGVSQKQIAASLGVPRSTVSRWLSERHREIPQRHRPRIWELWRQTRRERIVRLVDIANARIVAPEMMPVEQAREMLLAALAHPLNSTDAPKGIRTGTVVAAFGENLYMILLADDIRVGSTEKMLQELQHLVERLQRWNAAESALRF
jgi:excisionase family DNA binding protein